MTLSGIPYRKAQFGNYFCLDLDQQAELETMPKYVSNNLSCQGINIRINILRRHERHKDKNSHHLSGRKELRRNSKATRKKKDRAKENIHRDC